jgi:hypothetical protein
MVTIAIVSCDGKSEESDKKELSEGVDGSERLPGIGMEAQDDRSGTRGAEGGFSEGIGAVSAGFCCWGSALNLENSNAR